MRCSAVCDPRDCIILREGELPDRGLYNTASPEEKAEFDEKALCRAVGCMMFACAACFGLLMLSDVLLSRALLWAGLAAFILVIVVGVIYMNTSKKVKRK